MIGHKTEVGIIPKMFHRQSAKGNLNLWLCDQKSNMIPPLMIVDLCMKFESDRTKI